jgi:hypothetical protein
MALRAAEGESHRYDAVERGFKPTLCGSGCVGIAPAPLLQALPYSNAMNSGMVSPACAMIPRNVPRLRSLA